MINPARGVRQPSHDVLHLQVATQFVVPGRDDARARANVWVRNNIGHAAHGAGCRIVDLEAGQCLFLVEPPDRTLQGVLECVDVRAPCPIVGKARIGDELRYIKGTAQALEYRLRACRDGYPLAVAGTE